VLNVKPVLDEVTVIVAVVTAHVGCVTVAVGAAGNALGAAVPVPATLEHPFTVAVTV
jgi:hypothetical protein